MRVLTVTAVLAVASTSAAATRIAIFPATALDDQVTPEVADKLTRTLYEEMRLSGLEPVVLRFSNQKVPARTSRAAKKAQRMLDKALAMALTKEKNRRAHKRLKQATRRAAKYVNELPQPQLLTQAYIELARRERKPRRARNFITQALHLTPNLDVPYNFSRKHQRLFINTKTKLQRKAGEIRVTSSPSGADVVLDGTNYGRTPLIMEGVFPGKHVLTIRSTVGGKNRRAMLSTRERRSIHVNIVPDYDQWKFVEASVGANQFHEAVRKQVMELAAARRASYVVIPSLRHQDGLLYVQTMIGRNKQDWTLLPTVTPDTEMLAGTVEANTLTQHIARTIENGAFGPLPKMSAFVTSIPTGNIEPEAPTYSRALVADGTSSPLEPASAANETPKNDVWEFNQLTEDGQRKDASAGRKPVTSRGNPAAPEAL